MPATVIGPNDGRSLLNDFAIYKLTGDHAEGRFALVEHRIAPGQLAAPMHTHTHEDEYSFVLEGELSALIGGQLVRGGPGSLVVKPRGVPHTFWNEGKGRLRLLEIISPAGFETYFDEISQLIMDSAGQPEPGKLAALTARYGLEMDFSSLEEIQQKYGVALPGAVPPGEPL